MKRKSLAEMSLIAFGLLLTFHCSTCHGIELLHWTFDQVDGVGPFTTPDSSGRENTGTLTSMDNPVPVPGRVGNALQFSNAGTSTSTRDRVEILTADVNTPTDLNRTYTQFTFAAFVKPTSIADEEPDTTWIAGKLGTSNTRGWQIGLTGTDAQVTPPENQHPDDVVVSMFSGPLSTDPQNEFYSGPAVGPIPPVPPDPTALPNNEWTHVAFTFSSTTEATAFFRLYINGVKIVDVPTDLAQLNGVNTRAFQVGNRGDSRADSWGGLIDDVRLFDNALTDAEILALIPPLPPSQTGDFNQNGVVDAADYVVWRKNVGSASALPNDNGTTLPVGNDHYNLWRSNFGNGAGSGAGVAAGAVPEPTSLLLTIGAIASAFGSCRRRS